MRLAGLKNGNHEQRTRSEGLEGAKGGECYVCDFQTQAEGAKDSAVTLEEPASRPIAPFRSGRGEERFRGPGPAFLLPRFRPWRSNFRSFFELYF
jgi:hypothetical protein